MARVLYLFSISQGCIAQCELVNLYLTLVFGSEDDARSLIQVEHCVMFFWQMYGMNLEVLETVWQRAQEPLGRPLTQHDWRLYLQCGRLSKLTISFVFTLYKYRETTLPGLMPFLSLKSEDVELPHFTAYSCCVYQHESSQGIKVCLCHVEPSEALRGSND